MRRFMMFTAIILCAVLLAGCNRSALLEPARTFAPTPSPAPTPVAADTQKSYGRLSLIRCEQNYGSGNALIYPAVDSDEYKALNDAIFKKVLSGVGQMSVPVYTYFSILCNQDGILSMVLGFYDMDTRELYLRIPVTYDTETGTELNIEDCFIEGSGSWRGVLPDIVTSQAASRGITLLSDMLPIEDGQLFYITAKSVVLVYRPYEISTYSAGWPEFAINFEQIDEYLDPECAAARIWAKNATETEEVNG